MLYPIINKEAAEKAWQEVAKGAVAHVIADSQDGSLTGAMLCQELFRAHGYLAHLERQHLEIKLELERAKLPIVRREVEVQQAVASALSEEKDGKGNAKKAFSNEDARAAEVERRMGIDTIAVPLAQTVALLTALDQRLLVEMRVQQRRYDAFALLLQSATADVYRDIARRQPVSRIPGLTAADVPPADLAGVSVFDDPDAQPEPEFSGELFEEHPDTAAEAAEDEENMLASQAASDEAEYLATRGPE